MFFFCSPHDERKKSIQNKDKQALAIHLLFPKLFCISLFLLRLQRGNQLSYLALLLLYLGCYSLYVLSDFIYISPYTMYGKVENAQCTNNKYGQQKLDGFSPCLGYPLSPCLGFPLWLIRLPVWLASHRWCWWGYWSGNSILTSCVKQF